MTEDYNTNKRSNQKKKKEEPTMTDQNPEYNIDMTAEQKQSIKLLMDALKNTDLEAPEDLLWSVLIQLQGYPFYTAKNLEFFYIIKGNEMFVTRKDKSVTRASIMATFHKALQLERTVTGPKKLGTFGASYLYPVFKKIGVIQS